MHNEKCGRFPVYVILLFCICWLKYISWLAHSQRRLLCLKWEFIKHCMLVSGVPERVDYAPLSGVEILFPSAQLKLCDIPCNINRVSSRLTLSTSHIGKGCDRDTYSVQSQRKICGTLREFQIIYTCLLSNF